MFWDHGGRCFEHRPPPLIPAAGRSVIGPQVSFRVFSGLFGFLLASDDKSYIIHPVRPQPKISVDETYIVTGRHLKAARALAGWTAAELAKASGVGVATIRRSELKAGEIGVSAPIDAALRTAFGKVGVLFMEGDDGLGVKLVRN